jgi:3-methyladenine DNA glycosylase/8-oxoguanine DNA glycosylase
MSIEHRAGVVTARAWGPGAERVIATLPRLRGADDEPEAFAPEHPLLRQLVVRFRGVRFGATDRTLEALVPAICEQKVTGTEAHRVWRAIVLRFGTPAPGPWDEASTTTPRLWLAPTPATLARVPYYELHPAGLERRRAEVIARVAARSAWLEAAGALPSAEALARLMAMPGIGPWTAAETARSAFGDPDAVSVGDFHLADLVVHALTGRARGTDAQMLDLLVPWTGQRARVVRLIELSGVTPPKFGPRFAPNDIRRI